MEYVTSGFSDEYSDDFVEQCKALKEFGIDYMEIRGVNGKNVSVLNGKEVLNAKKILDDYAIKVSAVGSPIGKIRLDGDLNAHFETAKRIFGTANTLGAKYVRVFSFYLEEGKTRKDCKGQVFDLIGGLIKISEEYGVVLCHENEALIYGESPDNCAEILDYFGGRIKAVFDMGNFVLDGYEPLLAYDKLYKHIEYFHIKDALSAGAVVPAGKGEAKIAEILGRFKKNAVKDTFITLEPHLQTFSGLNALVGKSFENPYKYSDRKSAFTDAVKHLQSITAAL